MSIADYMAEKIAIQRLFLPLAAVCLGFSIAGAQGQDPGQRVQAVVRSIQQNVDGNKAVALTRTLTGAHVPAMLAALRRIEHAVAFRRIAERLRQLDAQPTIPILIDSLERTFHGTQVIGQHPGQAELERWGWRAIGPALRGLKSPSYRVRLGCAQFLGSRAPYAPHDKRLFPAYRDMARSQDPAFRLIATRALSGQAIGPRIDRNNDGWMPFDLYSLPALAELARLTVDDDHGIRHLAATELYGLMWSRGAGKPGRLDPMTASQLLDQFRPYAFAQEPGLRITALTLMAFGSNVQPEHYAALADPVQVVRLVAEALLEDQNSPSVPRLSVFLRHKNATIRAAAARLLGWSFSNSALPALRQALADKDQAVRRAASQAIRRIQGF